MILHEWWDSFGIDGNDLDDNIPDLARELISLLDSDEFGGINVTGIRRSDIDNCLGVSIEVEVERPQDLVYPVKAIEPIAVIFPFDGGQPSVLSIRNDFPDTPHQNWVPAGMPCALCIDDRPWDEARLTTTGFDIARRIQIWLSKAAHGELHDTSQPPEPLFFHSQLKIVLPQNVLGKPEPVELNGFFREDNPSLIFTGKEEMAECPLTFTVIKLQAQPQGISRLRHAPRTLDALALELNRCGISLYDELVRLLKGWAGLGDSNFRRLSASLAVVVAFPILTNQQQDITDIRAFITHNSAGDIGVALGVLHVNTSEVGDKQAYTLAIPTGNRTDNELPVEPAQVHLELNRRLAATMSGKQAPDCRKAVVVGAGSLGSQVSLNLAREGAFAWTVIDDDYLLPHNLVRHPLYVNDVGAPKADALAQKLSGVLNEPVGVLRDNVLDQGENQREKSNAAFAEAEVIIDASASVAVSRYLCDVPNVQARRLCAYFNPAGTSVVLLVENSDRSITLRDLEAQYYRILLTDRRVAKHLDQKESGVRYSGSCRALTNRISASNAALLSAIVSRGVSQALDTDVASVSIWTLKDNGEVHLVSREGLSVSRLCVGDWTLAYDAGLVFNITALREKRLPNETGGALLGIVDMSNKSIHVAHAMPQPEDSCGTPSSFERGVFNLLEQVSNATAATMDQVRYVGEWHSHPDGNSADPSSTDLIQANWLSQEMQIEGLRGIVAIAAGNGVFSLTVGDTNTCAEKDL